MLRITMRPIATLLRSVIASSSSLYGFDAALVGDEVVRLLEVQRVDLVEVDELLDLDRVAPLRAQRLDLVVLDHHVLALRDLVAADDLVGG